MVKRAILDSLICVKYKIALFTKSLQVNGRKKYYLLARHHTH
jgi:hypothetical protein